MRTTVDHIRLMQQALEVPDDGIWGPITERAYQEWLLSDAIHSPLTLSAADYRYAAEWLEVSEAAIRAVVEVESRGSGFLHDGRPTILFEAHVFGKRTRQRYTADHPELSSRTWNRALYLGGAREWDRLNAAMRLDRREALRSASWGMFQIMGFNHEAAGHESIERFVEAHERSARDHLDAFCALILNWGLARHLRNRDWPSFARRYNGPGYRQNRYDDRLASAYRSHTGSNVA